MLSPQTISVIKSTVPVLQTHGTEITKNFYGKLFTAHPELLNIFNHANQRKGSQPVALANAVYAAAANIDQLETILPVVKMIGHKHVSLGVKPEHYPIVGENLLAAMKDVLGDAATPEILGAWAEAYGVIADAFIGVEADMYKEAELKPGGWKDYRNFRVDRKVKESDVITSFYLVPEDGGLLADYQPGQYIAIKLTIPGEQYTHIRQYSLSGAPGKPYYRISVKREPGAGPDSQGVVSNYLHSNIKEGDILELAPPGGDFTLDTTSNTPVVLLSGGVGLTPLVSMLHTVVEKQPDRHVTFIHAAISGKHHALRDEVKQAAEKATNTKAYFVYECPDDDDTKSQCFHQQGYINLDWLQKVIPDNNAEFYFCGPLPFMKAIHKALNAWGVPAERQHFEVFGPAENLDA